MKTKLILLFIIFSFKCYSQTLSKQVRNDFCNNALFEYKYGNNTFRAVMNIAIRNIGANTLEELIGTAENICYNPKLQDEFFSIIYSLGRNRDLIFLQFHSIGMKAENASILTDYLLEKSVKTKKRNVVKKNEEAIQIKETPKPKLYNLEEKDVESYNKSVEQQKNTIFDYFKNGTEKLLKSDLEIPTFEDMIKEKNITYTFDNTYNIYYKTINDINKQISGFENLNGSDKKSNLFKNKNMIIIPTIKENKNEIMTELSIKNVRFIYKKGYVFAKIKKKQFILENSSVLEKNIENEIKSKMQQQKNGNYLIGYIYINVMGKEDLIVNFEELKKDNSVLNRFLLKSSYSIMRSLL